jgi:predicted transcriptional regulator
MRSLGQQIRDLRMAYCGAGMTQAELAKRAGLSWNFIAKVEAGDRLPSLSSLDRIARVLGAKVRIELVK